MSAKKIQVNNPEEVTVPASVFQALLNACLAVSDHEGDACWQEDWFKYHDKAAMAVNLAARHGLVGPNEGGAK